MNQMNALKSPAASAAPAARRIGRFSIERELGRGTIGIVYLSRDPVIDRQVAIKTFNPALSAVQRKGCEEQFINEARAAGRLSHPNIVTIYEASNEGGTTYVAMEYLQGRPLSSMIEDAHAFSISDIATIFLRMAGALDYAHRQGVVHRDIKPANIFMVRDRDPRLLDFGIAKAPNRVPGHFMTDDAPYTMYRKDSLLGSPTYMSPEQALHQPIDARSDIYSLGAVMYELLAGRKPFVAQDISQLLEKIAYKAAKPVREVNPLVPEQLANIVMRAMAKKPEKRHQTAAELVQDIKRYIAVERRVRSGERRARPRTADTTRSSSGVRASFFQNKISWPGFVMGLSSIALLGVAAYKPLLSILAA